MDRISLVRPDDQSDPAAARIFAVNDQMNQMLIEQLDPDAWRSKTPAKGRTIAAISTHMHNVRCKWVRLTAPHIKAPEQLNRTTCTQRQAQKGLAESATRCSEMLAEAMGGPGGPIETFRRDSWARPWPIGPGPIGPEMLCYMICHEAHHRGQVCLLARQLGFPFSKEVESGIWNWEKLLAK